MVLKASPKSQYHPCNINILVGKKSQFLYEAAYTTLQAQGAHDRAATEEARSYRGRVPTKARCAQEIVLATLRPDQ
ncbi:hypothetical protein MASR2M78_16670 [Treponema sp.]